MILLPVVWTVVTALLLTSGSSQFLHQENTNKRYPMLHSTEAIDCDCRNISCAWVFWFRTMFNSMKVQYIGRCNQADRIYYADDVDKARFKINRKNQGSFTLHINNITKEDAGMYSCVVKDLKQTTQWNSGTALLPGETPPSPPKTIQKPKPPIKPICNCLKDSSQGGCGSLILWPMVGLIVALAITLICTLYYYSRLPKKCRHRFTKKR